MNRNACIPLNDDEDDGVDDDDGEDEE